MKKFLMCLLIVCTILSTMCVFATEEVVNNAEVIGNEADDSQIVQIDDYEEYEKLFADEETLSDEEYEEAYESQMETLIEYYEEMEMPKAIKAKVVVANDPEYLYEADYTGFLYKMKKQDVEIEILEGDYVGEKTEIVYPLMADSLLNLEVPELKKGDVIYVAADVDSETGELYVEPCGFGFNTERKTGLIILALVAIVLVVVFGKDRGMLSVLIGILIVSLTILICSEQIYLGTSIILLSLILAAVLVSTIVIQKLGLTKDALWTALSCMAIIILTTFVTFGVDYMLKNTGGTFDTMLTVENIIKRNIDFHHMFVGSIILILSAVLPYVVCNVWKKCKESNENDFNKLLDVSKDAATGKIEVVIAIFTALLIPKLVYLYSYRYTVNEIINSEVVATEFIRMFMCIIAIALSIPATAFIYKVVGEKNITENNNK